MNRPQFDGQISEGISAGKGREIRENTDLQKKEHQFALGNVTVGIFETEDSTGPIISKKQGGV